MNETQFPGDDCSLKYARDAGVFIPEIDWEVAHDRKRFSHAEVMSKNPAAIFCFGQSNAANHGMGSYRPRHPVYCFNPMDCEFYLAEDPIPGATGFDGSPWGRLGDLMVEGGHAKSVVFISVAFGGTYCLDWAPGGGPARRLALSIERAKRAGIEIERMLWCQGEAEANNTQMRRSEYRHHFLAMNAEIRRLGVNGELFVARATLCATEGRPFDNREEIRAAQAEVVDPALDVIAGPDMDEIGLDERHDGCHFNERGLQHAADLWWKVIAAQHAQRTLNKFARKVYRRMFGTLPKVLSDHPLWLETHAMSAHFENEVANGARILWISESNMPLRRLASRASAWATSVDLLHGNIVDSFLHGEQFDACVFELAFADRHVFKTLYERARTHVGAGGRVYLSLLNTGWRTVALEELEFFKELLPDTDLSEVSFSGGGLVRLLRNFYALYLRCALPPMVRPFVVGGLLIGLAPLTYLANRWAKNARAGAYRGNWMHMLARFNVPHRIPIQSASGGDRHMGESQ